MPCVVYKCTMRDKFHESLLAFAIDFERNQANGRHAL